MSTHAPAAPPRALPRLELIPREVVPGWLPALRGSPPQRLAHLQVVLPLAAQAEDPDLKAF